MITFPCKHCGEPLEGPDSLAGESFACPQCGHVNPVPDPSLGLIDRFARKAPKPARTKKPTYRRAATAIQILSVFGGLLGIAGLSEAENILQEIVYIIIACFCWLTLVVAYVIKAITRLETVLLAHREPTVQPNRRSEP